MVSARAVGAGVLALPPVVVWAALAEPAALLLVGAVPGAVAGALADPGGRSGLVHGLLVGGLCTLLFWALLLGWVTLSPPGYVAPGFGLSVVLLGAFGLFAGLQSAVAGVVVGLVRR
jgi:hypothetical protein